MELSSTSNCLGLAFTTGLGAVGLLGARGLFATGGGGLPENGFGVGSLLANGAGACGLNGAGSGDFASAGGAELAPS